MIIIIKNVCSFIDVDMDDKKIIFYWLRCFVMLEPGWQNIEMSGVRKKDVKEEERTQYKQ